MFRSLMSGAVAAFGLSVLAVASATAGGAAVGHGWALNRPAPAPLLTPAHVPATGWSPSHVNTPAARVVPFATPARNGLPVVVTGTSGYHLPAAAVVAVGRPSPAVVNKPVALPRAERADSLRRECRTVKKCYGFGFLKYCYKKEVCTEVPEEDRGGRRRHRRR